MNPPAAVAVVGAGLAGLSTAIFLARAGVRVDLYEQNQTLEAQGVETTVGVLTQMAYLKAGVDLAPLLRRIGQRVSTYRILRGSGAEVSNEPVDAAAQHYGLDSYDVCRPELMEELTAIFVGLAGAGALHLGVGVVAIDEGITGTTDTAGATGTVGTADTTATTDGGVTLQLSDGSTARAALVVAADGIRSSIRRGHFDDHVPPEFLGTSAVYGLMKGRRLLAAERPESFHLILEDKFSIVTSSFKGRSPGTWMALVLPTETPINRHNKLWDGGDTEAARGAVEALLQEAGEAREAGGEGAGAGAGGGIGQLATKYLAETDEFLYSGGLYWRKMAGKWDQSWSRGRVMLIGDAVHAMTPWGGYSGQMAVEDAFVLADAIVSRGLWRCRDDTSVRRATAGTIGNVEVMSAPSPSHSPSPLRFDARVAVITGSGRGLGRAYALDLARRGCRVVINDLDAQAADAVVAEICTAGGVAVASYVSVTEGAAIVGTALAAFGRIDIVVCNAGIAFAQTFRRMTREQWRKMVDVHVSQRAVLQTHTLVYLS